MIQTTINNINKAVSGVAVPNKVMGLAQPVIVQDGSEVTIPMLSVEGEDLDVFIDDDYYFGLYHKINNKSYANQADKGFGSNVKILCNADLSLICWGFERYFTADEMEKYIISCLPENARVYLTDFDKKRVFNGEFSNVGFFVNEGTFLFKMNYKIQFEVKKDCIINNTLLTKQIN